MHRRLIPPSKPNRGGRSPPILWRRGALPQVLTKKKADLMSQYASETLLAEQADARQLLNKK